MSFASVIWRVTLPLLLAAGGCAGEDPLFTDVGGLRDGAAGETDQLDCRNVNHDGVIDLSEVTLRAGLMASYRVNPPGSAVAVDVAGRDVDGELEWDLSSREGSVVSLGLEPIDSAWFAARFPGAQFVASDVRGETLQVLALEGDRLLLLGLASRVAERTLMVYQPPVALLRFPLRVGDRFVSEGQVDDGVLEGLPIATRDSYAVQVDAAGKVRLPFFRIDALRVRVDVSSRVIGGTTLTTRQVQWFAECYAEIARAVSATTRDPDVPAADFTTATELRRLSYESP